MRTLKSFGLRLAAAQCDTANTIVLHMHNARAERQGFNLEELCT